MAKPKLLLHTCCAPCSGSVVAELLADYSITIYYSNANIYPESEYQKRLNEVKSFFGRQQIPLIADLYNHQKWLGLVQVWAKDPERGRRCKLCYWQRLAGTAWYAKNNNFDLFGSTLTISPHKDSKIINHLGQALAKKYQIDFLAGDWKKNDGFKKSVVFSRENEFYRQNYCGCEFSIPVESK